MPFWIPRIIAILFVMFISLFALDVFSEGYSPLQLIVGLFMHLIPSIIMTLFIIFAWRNGLILGLPFIGFGIWYIWEISDGPAYQWFWALEIALPALIVGFLSIYEWMQARKK
ncbi:MAG: hypothetical protein V1660_01275 [archaeon]